MTNKRKQTSSPRLLMVRLLPNFPSTHEGWQLHLLGYWMSIVAKCTTARGSVQVFWGRVNTRSGSPQEFESQLHDSRRASNKQSSEIGRIRKVLRRRRRREIRVIEDVIEVRTELAAGRIRKAHAARERQVDIADAGAND